MEVRGRTRVTAKPVNGEFPWPIQPRFMATDQLSFYGPQNCTQYENMFTDRIADCVHARSIFVPHNQGVPAYGGGGHTLPVWHWDDEDPQGLTGRFFGQMGFIERQVDLGNRYEVSSDHTLDPMMGFYFLSRMYSPNANAHFYLDFQVGNGTTSGGRKTYGILFGYSVAPKVGEYLGGEFRELQGMPVATNPIEHYFPNQRMPYLYHEEPNAPPPGDKYEGDFMAGGYNWLEVKFVGGYLQVKISTQDTPFVWVHQTRDEDDEPVGRILKVTLRCFNEMRINFSGHQMMFAKSASLTSKYFNLGFVPQTLPVFDVRHAWYKPNGIGVAIQTGQAGTNFLYKLYIENPLAGTWDPYPGSGWAPLGSSADHTYSKVTAAIRAVNYDFLEIAGKKFGLAQFLYPEEVRVHQDLDLGDMSIRSGADLIFNNFDTIANVYGVGPPAFWGEWANYNGAIAVTVEMMIDVYNPANGALLYSSNWQRMFTGYGNVHNVTEIQEGGRSKFIMHCMSREAAMMSPKFNLPWFDGWNHYYAAAFMANVSGCRVGTPANTDLAFRAHVPATMFGDDPTGEPSYFLPIGSGGTPLQKYPAGEKPWSALAKQCLQVGFIRYFDALGKLHYEKFDPTIPQAPYRTFDIVDESSFGTNPSRLSAILGGNVERNLLEVRNKVTVIGVDSHGPTWFPLVSHRSDPGSMFSTANTIWGPTAGNFLGFENSFVMVDSQFADAQFASDAADAFFRVMRLPPINTAYTLWLQPDIYPGKWVGFYDRRSGTYDVASNKLMAMMVFGTLHRVRNGEVPTTSLRCKFIPGFFNPSTFNQADFHLTEPPVGVP